MKPQEVIYYNEYSGKTELCTRADVKHGQSISTEYGTVYPLSLTEKLLIDGEFRFTLHGITMDLDDYRAGKPKMSPDPVIREAVFKLISKSDTCIRISLTEYYNDKGLLPVGCISFEKKPNCEINGVKGNAIIRIYDVNIGASWHFESNHLLGRIALAVGLYLFVDINGKWGKYKNIGNFVDISLDEQTKQLKDQMEDVAKSIKQDNEIIKAKQDEVKQSQNEMTNIIEQRFDNIDNELSQIHRSIIDLSSSLKEYKTDLNLRLESLDSEKDKDEEREHFADQISIKILNAMDSYNNIDKYNQSRNELLSIFGNEWEKLSEQSQNFLITSKLLFSQMCSMNKDMDYSGVCILVTKALEIELKKRLYYDFMDFLGSKYNNDFNKWHYSLYETKKIGSTLMCVPLDERHFTLGSIAYITFYIKDKKKNNEKYAESQKRLYEYCQSVMNDDYTGNRYDLLGKMKSLGKAVNRIKDKYRNPAAHTNSIGKTLAQECFDDVIFLEKIMINLLKMFK